MRDGGISSKGWGSASRPPKLITTEPDSGRSKQADRTSPRRPATRHHGPDVVCKQLIRWPEGRNKLPIVEETAGHAFISYVREDVHQVDQLQQVLEAAGISVWRDTAALWPGEEWRRKIRHAITDNALVFIACFSDIVVSLPPEFLANLINDRVAHDDRPERVGGSGSLHLPQLINEAALECFLGQVEQDIGFLRRTPITEDVDLQGHVEDHRLYLN